MSSLPQVFAMFSELVAGACQQADEGGGGDSGDSGGRSRMEDELMIFVRKQLSSAQGQHRRVGIIGTVALVQARLAGWAVAACCCRMSSLAACCPPCAAA